MTSVRLVAMAAFIAAGLAAPYPSTAQEYPARYVRVITAGSGTIHDIVARLLAQRLSEQWGQGVVIDNQPAAGMTIGAGIAAKAAPDGYTLLLADRSALAVAPALYKTLRYDPVADFRPITLVARIPAVLAIQSSIPARDLHEFIAYARQRADPIVYASAGAGSMVHLAGVLFGQLTGIEMLTVQYKGGPAAVMAVLNGEASLTVSSASIAPHLAAGNLRALAVGAARRLDALPSIPTSREAGLGDFEAEQWIGMLAPAGTPDAVIEKLNRDVGWQLGLPEIAAKLQPLGAQIMPGTPAEFAAFIISESDRMQAFVRGNGVHLDQAVASSMVVGQSPRLVGDVAYHAAGATAIFDANPFERRFRDLHTVTQQLQGREAHYETVGQFLLGLDADTTWL